MTTGTRAHLDASVRVKLVDVRDEKTRRGAVIIAIEDPLDGSLIDLHVMVEDVPRFASLLMAAATDLVKLLERETIHPPVAPEEVPVA